MYSLNFTSERLALFVCKPKAAKSSINLVAQRKRNYEHKRAQCVRNATNCMQHSVRCLGVANKECRSLTRNTLR